MTEETRPGFLANYKIVRPGPQFKKSARARPGPHSAGPVDTSNNYTIQQRYSTLFCQVSFSVTLERVKVSTKYF